MDGWVLCYNVSVRIEMVYPSPKITEERGRCPMKYKHWAVAPPCPQAQAELEAAGLPPLLARILAARGVATPEQARRRLSPEE